MDKEAQEKITEIVSTQMKLYGNSFSQPDVRYPLWKRALDIAKYILRAMEELGYRKLKDKPPLLSDKETNYAVTDAEMARYSGWDEVQRARQWEADIKHYEGK